MLYLALRAFFDCFQYENMYFFSVCRLFFHIVESDKIGTQILKEINNQKLPGEVTFMPCNRMTVRPMKYPSSSVSIW